MGKLLVLLLLIVALPTLAIGSPVGIHLGKTLLTGVAGSVLGASVGAWISVRRVRRK